MSKEEASINLKKGYARITDEAVHKNQDMQRKPFQVKMAKSIVAHFQCAKKLVFAFLRLVVLEYSHRL